MLSFLFGIGDPVYKLVEVVDNLLAVYINELEFGMEVKSAKYSRIEVIPNI